MTLFFVLSGFLITSLLTREMESSGSIRLGRFYFRRAYRLFPALVVYLLGAGIIAALQGRELSWIWNETWPAVSYTANYADLVMLDLAMNWHTWSLAVEEHFYLVWPVILLALPVGRRARLVSFGLVLLLMWSVVARWANPAWGHASTDANASALAAGCLLALVMAARRDTRAPVWAPLLAITALVLSIPIAGHPIGQPVVVLISSICVLLCATNDSGALAATPWGFLGKISYPLYLWHVPLLMVAGSAIGWRAAAVGGAMVIAWLSWAVVERPMMQNRDRHWAAITSGVGARRRAAIGAGLTREQAG